MLTYSERKELVGTRIRQGREALGLSRKEFLLRIYKSESSHKTLTAWENGERLPDLDSLALMADLFDCDIGYLLGDYKERHHITTDICKETGLSELAAENLMQINHASNGDDYLNSICKYLSFLLEHQLLVKPVIDASAYIDAAIGIKHYVEDVLPAIAPSAEFNSHLSQLETDKISAEDTERSYKETKVRAEIKRLKDICTVKRYYCEKAAASAISGFIDHLEEQYGIIPK